MTQKAELFMERDDKSVHCENEQWKNVLKALLISKLKYHFVRLAPRMENWQNTWTYTLDFSLLEKNGKLPLKNNKHVTFYTRVVSFYTYPIDFCIIFMICK